MRDPIRDVIGTCCAQIGAITTPILSPLIIGALIVGLNIGEIEAGSLITTELFVIGLTSIVLAPFMPRLPHHILAISAALLLVVSLLLSSQANNLNELYAWRVLGGVGGGCLVATVNAAIAQSRSPTFLYGLSWAVAYTVTALLAVIISKSNDVVIYDSVYKHLALAIALTLPLLWLIPRHGGSDESHSPFPKDTISAGILLMLGISLISVSMMTYYAFLGQLAVAINATASETGWIIAAAQIAGIIGGLSAAPLAKLFGVVKALVLSVILHVAAIALAIYTDEVLILGIAAFLEATLFIIMTPLMFTLAAQIDDKGRWAAAAGGVFTLANALGPVIGAILIENIGYAAIVCVQLIAATPAILFFVRVDRMSRKIT
jgi:predicted MFS family arabinose efflux permease